MAYALFKDGEKLSRTFSTKEETLKRPTTPVWSKAVGVSPGSRTT